MKSGRENDRLVRSACNMVSEWAVNGLGNATALQIVGVLKFLLEENKISKKNLLITTLCVCILYVRISGTYRTH